MAETAIPWFVESFSAMVAELEAHPRIEITHRSPLRRFTKTGKTTFDAALKGFVKKEPKALRHVFAALGGFSLRWFLHSEPLAKKRKAAPSLVPRDLELPPFATGCIAFVNSVLRPPLEGIILLPHHDDTRSVSINGRDYPEASFRASLRPFDQGQYETVEWASAPGGTEGLVFGMDAHAVYGDKLVDVDTYLRLLLATRGAVALRRRYFEGTWALPETPPPLEDILAQLDASSNA